MMKFIVFFTVLFASVNCEALERQAERFVRLGLEVGQHDPDYVDAYLGPPEWKTAVLENPRSKEEVAAEVRELLAELEAPPLAQADQVDRHRALLGMVRAMDTRMRMALGETFSFAEEARLIYDVVVPDYDFSAFDRALAEVEAMFPGGGELAERVDRFEDSVNLPEGPRDAVIRRAIDECRTRTLEHIKLPPGEGFRLEYVTGKTWGGYNWYQGGNVSLMMINLDNPLQIGDVIRLGCHEGYPGHHVWNVLVENQLWKQNGWVEYSLYPLFSPFALMAEGSANYGVYLAFPGNERSAFERDVLYPMAGLDTDKIETLGRLRHLTAVLGHARTATVQQYLDGIISRAEAVDRTRRYLLVSAEKAERSVRFAEKYRSYVVNYTLGEDIVKSYIETQSETLDGRWEAFERMLTELKTASDMIDAD